MSGKQHYHQRNRGQKENAFTSFDAFFKDIQKVVLKYVGIDSLIENMVLKLGQVESAYVIGDYAKGKDSGIIDMVLIGEIDKSILLNLATKTVGFEFFLMLFIIFV